MHPRTNSRFRAAVISCFGVAVFSIGVSPPSVFGQVPTASSESDDVFLFKPDTPVRQIRGAILAERLERPAIAQGYLNDLLESQPSTEVLLELRREFGIGTFLKLSSIRELQPTSRELLNLINEATTQVAPSASSVELLIAELGTSKQQTKEAALRILSAEGEAVLPLLNADVSTPQGAIADELLVKFARRLREGLLAALPDAEEGRKARILNLLGTTADPQLVSDLIIYCFDKSEPVSNAAMAAVDRLSEGRVTVGSRKESAESLMKESTELIRSVGLSFTTTHEVLHDRNMQKRYLATDVGIVFGAASLARAAKLMQNAAGLNPDEPTFTAGLIVAEATEQNWNTGWPKDFAFSPDVADSTEPANTDVLAMQLAIETGNPASTFALVKDTTRANAVFRTNPDIQRAYLLSPDPRTRLMTAAIASANSVSGSLVTNALSAAAYGSDRPEAVIIDSRISEASNGAAVLESLKYAAAGASSGQQGFELTTNQLNCELVLIHSNCLRWSLSHTIANLRADYRTQNTPIIIYGPENDRASADFIATHKKGIWFIPEPLSEITLPDHLKIDEVPGPVLNADERKQMILFAQELQ